MHFRIQPAPGQSGFKIVAGKTSGAFTVGGSVFGFGTELGVALLAVGYIVGLNIAVLVFAGGLISWLFGIPIYTVGFVLLMAAAVMTIWSMFFYLKAAWPFIMADQDVDSQGQE